MKRIICLLLTLLLCVTLLGCDKDFSGELPKLSENEIEKIEFDEENYIYGERGTGWQDFSTE